MVVRVLLFGPEAAAAGRSSVDVDVAEPATCGAVLEAVARMGVGTGGARLAVNREFAARESFVRAGDEVAMIGLVSGG